MTLLREPHLHLSPPSPVLLYSLLILKIDATLLYFLVLLYFHWLVSLLLVSIFFLIHFNKLFPFTSLQYILQNPYLLSPTSGTSWGWFPLIIFFS